MTDTALSFDRVGSKYTRERVNHSIRDNMARALGLKSEGGNAFMKTMQGKGLGSRLPEKLRDKIHNFTRTYRYHPLENGVLSCLPKMVIHS